MDAGRLPGHIFQPACRPIADELLYDTHGHSGLFCVQQRIAEWSEKISKVMMSALLGLIANPEGVRFSYLIPNMGSGHWKCRFSGNESGVFCLKSRSCSHGDLWKLYGS